MNTRTLIPQQIRVGIPRRARDYRIVTGKDATVIAHLEAVGYEREWESSLFIGWRYYNFLSMTIKEIEAFTGRRD